MQNSDLIGFDAIIDLVGVLQHGQFPDSRLLGNWCNQWKVGKLPDATLDCLLHGERASG